MNGMSIKGDESSGVKAYGPQLHIGRQQTKTDPTATEKSETAPSQPTVTPTESSKASPSTAVDAVQEAVRATLEEKGFDPVLAQQLRVPRFSGTDDPFSYDAVLRKNTTVSPTEDGRERPLERLDVTA